MWISNHPRDFGWEPSSIVDQVFADDKMSTMVDTSQFVIDLLFNMLETSSSNFEEDVGTISGMKNKFSKLWHIKVGSLSRVTD